MSKNNLKKYIVCLITVLFLILTIRTTFASNIENIDDFLKQLSTDDAQNIPQGNRDGEDLDSGNNSGTGNNPGAGNNSDTDNNQKNGGIPNGNENLPKSSPDTGIANSSSIVFIVIFVASAVYAYVKVKKYEV